ncbi:hypothetical protein PENTCL1PPCAC_24720, partial [Pristionchus entomophagus]
KGMVECSMESTPTDITWKWKNEQGNPESGQIGINQVSCLDELDCNNMKPFTHCDEGDECTNAIFTGGQYKYANGGKLVDKSTNGRTDVHVRCDKTMGQWIINGKTSKKNRNDTKLIKLGCYNPIVKTTTHASPAAARSDMLVIGIVLGTLILLLLILLLIYCICCRKGRKVKDEPRKPEPPKTDSSTVKIPPPAPIAPVSTESNDAPALYGGIRVQMINMCKEHLREIEPDEDPTKEYSARDKTDSEKSQASQVGGTTDAGRTVTGRGTEATNEVLRTMGPGDDTRSYVSRGNTTGGDRSETGPGGNTPTIGDAEKKVKREERKGPKVQFRDRVSMIRNRHEDARPHLDRRIYAHCPRAARAGCGSHSTGYGRRPEQPEQRCRGQEEGRSRSPQRRLCAQSIRHQ